MFERESATALLSTATADIAIENPALYVAVYKADRPHYNSKQWAFLIGPSLETARSEGVRCGVESYLDSNEWPTFHYNQTIVPLWHEDDLLSRFMIAEIRDLAPLGAILRDQDVTAVMERTCTIAGDLATSSFAWLWEKMDILERKPECFVGECTAFRTFEQVGCNIMIDWCKYAVDELAERSSSIEYRKRKQKRLVGVHTKTLNFVSRWKQADDDEANLVASLNVESGQPSTISRSVQIVTGVLGATALETRQRVAERKQWKTTSEQEGEAGAKPVGSGSALISAQRTTSEHANEAKRVSKNVREKEATTELECARVTTTNLVVPRKPEKATGEKNIAKDDEESESTDHEEEARVTSTVKNVVTQDTQDEEDENETETESEDEDNDEDEDEEENDATDDNQQEEEDGDGDEDGDGEESDDASDDSDNDDVSDGDELKGMAEEEEEDEEENSEDSDDSSDNNSDDDEEGDAGDEESSGAHTTLKRIPALTSSA